MGVAASSADRNLLFGILALQMDFIGKDALIQAMQAWVFDKTKPLGDFLVGQGALRPERRTLLDALLQEHINQHDNDPHKSLAALSSVGSARKDLQEITDPDVQASLAQVSAASVDAFATRAPSMGAPTSVGTRFRILRAHARGGLGEVFVARDEELGREVALKEIQDRHADDQASRSRFVLEAEITGGLEHPGIVPVYGLGQYDDGRPFYAMRFIRGDSLKDAIERFHKQRTESPAPVDPGERALQFRKLLGRFLDVCEAIAYAHSRGILHRDLKPGNIMLGKYGETLVVDWGLAKPLGTQDGQHVDEAPLQPSSQSGTTETVAGSVIGTPQFMSPEQAAGRLDLLGPASDVYSLGATLYVLLTGKPAFSDSDVGTVLQKVQRGDFPPPRQVQRDVPRALEAICMKALALQASDRYATPRALADEIEHWLADEPVGAFREPVMARTARWARRHRTAVTAALAALLVAVLGLVTATVLLTAANERERGAKELAEANKLEADKQRDEAKKQRDKARERFQLARDAVDKFHTQVSESPEMKAEGVEQLRTKLLESAVEFYEKLSKEVEGSDPNVQRERGKTFVRLGVLYSVIGNHEQAEKAYLVALDVCLKLAADRPNVADYQDDLATTYAIMGTLYNDTGRHSDAEKAYQAALDIRKKLATQYPTVTHYQTNLAIGHFNLGCLYNTVGRRGEAEKAHQIALGIYKKLAADYPTVAQYQSGLANSNDLLSFLYGAKGRFVQAEKAEQASLEIRKKLVADHPTVTQYQSDLAVSLSKLGSLYSKTGRQAEAEQAYKAALAIRDKLATDHPTVTLYQHGLAVSAGELGIFYSNTGRYAAAEKAYRAAVDIFKKLASDHPTVTVYQSGLADSNAMLGSLYSTAGRNGDAENVYQAALGIYKKLAANHPTVSAYQYGLASSYARLGFLYSATGRLADAEKAFQACLSIRVALSADHSTGIADQRDLAFTHNSLGLLYSVLGRHADAVGAHQAALDIRKKARRRPSHRSRLSTRPSL
jgi:serine/threonine-protein kinase